MLEVIIMPEKLKITKRSGIKGDDGYRTFSVRVKEETVKKLEDIADRTNRSRNKLVNLLLEFGVENCEIVEK